MENDITPQAIEQMAVDARVPLIAVLNKAGFSSSAFYRWKRGGNVRELTKARLVDAANELKAASAA